MQSRRKDVKKANAQRCLQAAVLMSQKSRKL